jgi:hypothetical protein
MSESALVLLVPEAEPAVQALRARHDPVSTRGMPAHVTLLYPFVSPSVLDDVVLHRVREYFARQSPLRFALARVARFPAAVYLAPEPASPLVQWIEGLVALFPDTPPYGGRFPTIVPHLTVAQGDDPAQLDAVAAELAPALPIDVECDRAYLVMERRGYWLPEAVLPIGRG